MITVENIRSHVVEDAADLVSALGVVSPLLSSEGLQAIGREREQVAWFLRKLLSRNVALISVRLHELPDTGKSGETASIESLLKYADGLLSDEVIEEFRNRRLRIIAEMESDGTNFSDLRMFRTVEMAHSIHRDNSYSNNLFFHNLEKFAQATCDLVVDLDRALVAAGLTPYDDVPGLFYVWRERGERFWRQTYSA